MGKHTNRKMCQQKSSHSTTFDCIMLKIMQLYRCKP